MDRAVWIRFEQVKRAVRMGAVLSECGWRPAHRRGDQVQGRCPIHGGQRTDAFHADLGRGMFHCFSCQAQGSVLDLVAALEQCSVREAALRLSTRWDSREVRDGGALPAASMQRRKLVREKEKLAALNFSLHPIDSGCAYVKERGIERAVAGCFGVGQYAGPGTMRGRVVIPLQDEEGRLVAYAGRSIDGTDPKYRFPAGFPKSKILFNMHRASRYGADRVVVVEGFFDCLKVHQAGCTAVVGLMGCSLSARQQAVLLGRFSRILLMLDGDAAGRQGTAAAAHQLRPYCQVDVVHLQSGQQPDQLSADQIRSILLTAWTNRPQREEPKTVKDVLITKCKGCRYT